MDIEECRKKLREIEGAREKLLGMTREMKINASRAIASIHSGGSHEEHLRKAVELMERIYTFREKYPEIYFAITHDAMQEVVEAYCFSKVVSNDFNFNFDDLKAEPSAIITGLADLIGEIRRYALSSLIRGDFEIADKMIELMERIYFELITFSDLPDKLVPGLRHKLDVARASIERTKSDYIAAKVARLHESLDRD
jgi:translin